ncbi:LysR family transcriptional regulator [Cohaesibacter sp. CAU 1516]|uniref:LysR family transcriptional regulator n=1 Tax=Cohaesibacter sp. CAU 1516 TaxID=2576038 RepID=UPI0010FDD4CD|nr:LysR family transcriptional regulator [Cohaesibacter sp. CAU 1516]TLP44126.1 LysR family transcriptional regulator [Cohaesibacter sp. CAU 1516]
MDKLKFFESFIAAVETGSLTGAARQQQISQPAISQQISALEAAYATKLLHRARNGVSLTNAGTLFFDRVNTILKEHRELEEDLSRFSDGVTGQIKVTTNVGISQFVMLDVLNDLQAKYPDLKIILSPEDRVVDLVAEKFDLAVRSGTMGKENVVGRRIGSLRSVLVAKPAYLDELIRPRDPKDLQSLNYIQYCANDDMLSIPLNHAGEITHVPIKSNLTAQLPALVFQALENGMGYAKAPYFMVADAIEQGKLELVLPDYSPLTQDLFLVYPHHESNTLRMKVFLQSLLQKMIATPGIQIPKSVQREFSNQKTSIHG